MYYNDLSDYYKNKFGEKIVKLSFNGNFSCPNRENGKMGCSFCTGSYEYAGKKEDSLLKQYKEQKAINDHKWPNAKYIAYFGSFTNTYDKTINLKKRFEEVLTFPNVIGLSIATRSDTISGECLEYLKDLNKRTFLTIELGLQSMHDKTLKYINRGHDLQNFDECVNKLKKNNINVVVHIIDGLPGETEQMMLDTIIHLNKLHIDGIKIHNLFIVKNAPFAKEYNESKIKLLDKDDYINIVCKQLEIMNPHIVIHRLTGDPKKEDLIAPLWATNKIYILNGIVKRLKKDRSFQGKYFVIDK